MLGITGLTEERLLKLQSVKKRLVSSASPRPKQKAQHQEREYNLVSIEDEREVFKIYARQSLRLSDAFSCGIRWELPTGASVTLARFNGPSHRHPNKLEGTTVTGCHVHMATMRYIGAGLDPDGYAEESSEYTDLDGALRALVERFNVDGFEFDPVQKGLFG